MHADAGNTESKQRAGQLTHTVRTPDKGNLTRFANEKAGMHTETFPPDKKLKSYVKELMVLENARQENTVLPFFADGYPGIMFQLTDHGLFINPQNKMLPAFFLYGQTIHPIELVIKGKYRLIVFQLYPFAVKQLLEVDPKELNDACYDLTLLSAYKKNPINEKVQSAGKLSEQIALITSFLQEQAESVKKTLDEKIREAINLIVGSQGKITIREIRQQLHITERTFERKFLSLVGVKPKQFVKIIQFQTSLTQLNKNDFTKLTDIVFENGFVDQSHFIKSFKQFTGKTPTEFRRRKS
jgi:AraC-like DNA-binding protein